MTDTTDNRSLHADDYDSALRDFARALTDSNQAYERLLTRMAYSWDPLSPTEYYDTGTLTQEDLVIQVFLGSMWEQWPSFMDAKRHPALEAALNAALLIPRDRLSHLAMFFPSNNYILVRDILNRMEPVVEDAGYSRDELFRFAEALADVMMQVLKAAKDIL